MAILDIRSLSVAFGGLRALNAVSFAVEAGSFTSLVGPNGAGKTSVFNALSGLIRKSAGEIVFEGQRIDQLRPHEIARRGIGRTFQDPRVFRGMTVLENALSGVHIRANRPLHAVIRDGATRREWKAAIERVRAILETLSLGHRLNDQSEDLSFAEQRFLALARTLASDPKLLLLDEPTVGLDGRSIESFIARLRHLVHDRGLTVLMVEHNMDVVLGVSDEVHLLVQGEIVASGSAAEMKKHEKMVEAYLGDRYVVTDP